MDFLIVLKFVSVPPSQRSVFFAHEVDGREIRTSELETSQRNQGRGSQITPFVLTHPVAARPTRFTVSGATIYASPILAMVNPNCSVDGDVEFTPVEGHAYVVTGRLDPAACSVWIQDASTGQVVGTKVGGRGLH